MSRAPLRFRQSDLMRAMRAAQRMGDAWGVDILTDGTIRLNPAPKEHWKTDANPTTDDGWENVR